VKKSHVRNFHGRPPQKNGKPSQENGKPSQENGRLAQASLSMLAGAARQFFNKSFGCVGKMT